MEPYKCTKCLKEKPFEEIATISSSDDGCSPFMQMSVVCKECEGKEK